MDRRDRTAALGGLRRAPGADGPGPPRPRPHARPGRVAALVGATGAGKTTIANLLLRFIEPTAGGISGRRDPARPRPSTSRPGGAHVRASGVRSASHPFHGGAVADNLRLATPDADPTPRSAPPRPQPALAERRSEAWPRGLDTPTSASARPPPSGGQRQRLAIARAFLADARLVILDEATSHLDAESETVIRDAVGRLAARGRTVLVVSHRLRLAELADVVAVLDAGRVVEAGPPAELAAREGPYRRLLDSVDAP